MCYSHNHEGCSHDYDPIAEKQVEVVGGDLAMRYLPSCEDLSHLVMGLGHEGLSHEVLSHNCVPIGKKQVAVVGESLDVCYYSSHEGLSHEGLGHHDYAPIGKKLVEVVGQCLAMCYSLGHEGCSHNYQPYWRKVVGEGIYVLHH